MVLFKMLRLSINITPEIHLASGNSEQEIIATSGN